MPEYMHSRDGMEESEGFFCRFTFGQFFALLVLEVFTLFFIFYLGARYGRDILGLERQAQVAEVGVEEGAGGDAVKVQTTADPEVAKMAGELISKAETPELKDRIRSMIETAQGAKSKTPDKPEVIVVGESPPDGVPPAREQAAPAVTAESQEGAASERGEGTTAAMPKAAGQGPSEPTEALPSAQETPSTSAIRVKSADHAKYSVQVGSYPQAAEANKTAEFWKAKGYPAYVMIADIPERGRWYRVRLGGFETRKDAQNYLQEIKVNTDVDALVVMNEQ